MSWHELLFKEYTSRTDFAINVDKGKRVDFFLKGVHFDECDDRISFHR